MEDRIWIEAALNGPWTRSRQPNIPITVDEIVADGLACAAAGAAIIHIHAYDPVSGQQDDNWQTYARIIDGIRSQAEVIVYPTIPFFGLEETFTQTPQDRFAAVEELAQRGLIEWAVVDPGSVNLYDADAWSRDFVYLNPVSCINHGLELAARYGFHPAFAIYEPGFLRLGAALAAQMPTLPQPIYRMLFTDQLHFGLPPVPWGLQAYRQMLHETVPDAPWMIGGLAGDIQGIAQQAIACGGHVRTGLEDVPWECPLSNVQLVQHMVEHVRAAGAEPANASDVRSRLKSQADGAQSRAAARD